MSYTPIKATAVNAMTIAWSIVMCHVFCPFSIMGTVLQKIATDKTDAVVVASTAAYPHDLPRHLLTTEYSAFTDTTGEPSETAPSVKDET